MSRLVHDNDSNQPADSLASFEHLEGMINSQSDVDFEQNFSFDVHPSDFCAIGSGYSQDESGDDQSFHEEPLTNESIGADILHFDNEPETSGLLNDSELLNHRGHQYDSGSCPSEDDIFTEEGPDKGSTDLLHKYMEVTPRANTSLPDLDYASNEVDESFGSDDAFGHFEPSHNNNKVVGLPALKSPETISHHHMSNRITNQKQQSSLESGDESDGVSTELNDTMVLASDPNTVKQSTPEVHEENYGDSPPDHKDSDSASISIGQFVPNAVSRNRLPRPLGKPVKRSTPKNGDEDLASPSLDRLQEGSGQPYLKTPPRLSAAGSNRSLTSSRHSKGSHQDLSERSGQRGNKLSSSSSSGNKSHARSPYLSESRLTPSKTPPKPRRTSAASSADCSPSSEHSKLDLSQRLEEESRTRQQADELIEQLQKNYDELLGKYAQAENTIDQLKLGARVNLYGDGPTPRQGTQGVQSASQMPGVINLGQPQKASIHHTVPSSSYGSGGQGGEQVGHSAAGVQTNNNNAVGSLETRPPETVPTANPIFPALEGMLTSLAFQVKSQQDEIESFEMLLRENHLAPTEQKTVLDRLKVNQGKLESDYMRAKEEHGALRRRNSLLSSGTEVEFDLDRTLEGKIFQLGMKLEDVAEIVQNNLRSAPPPVVMPLPTNPPQRLANRGKSFQKQSNQHEHNEDEHDDPGIVNGKSRQSHSKGSSAVPRESEEEYYSDEDAPSLLPSPAIPRPNKVKETESRNKVQRTALPGAKETKQRYLQRPTSLNGVGKNANLRQQDPSENGLPSSDFGDNATGLKPTTNGFVSPEADSGFMGSESSRQSNQNGGLSGHNGHNQIGKLRERSSKVPVVQRSPPQVTRRLPRNWESPQFSDYDISEQDEDTDEVTTPSVRARKRNVGSAGQTSTGGVLHMGRSGDRPKQKESMNLHEKLLQSKQQHSVNKRQKEYQLHKEPQHTTARQNSERRGTLPRHSRKLSEAWGDHKHKAATYPEPAFKYRPSTSQDDTYSSQDNLEESTKRKTDPRPGNATRSVGLPEKRSRVAPPRSHRFDTDSDVTRSSGRSEVISHLQDEIEHLRRQMSKLKSPEKTQRISPSKQERPPSPGFRKIRRGSCRSEASSNRSETLRALQAEINDLRNQVNEREVPPLTYSSPMSRTSLRDPLNDYPNKSRFNSPSKVDPLRETLRQTYIPNSIPLGRPYTRTPTRSFLHSSSPARNPINQFESSPFVDNTPYNPEVSYRSPSPTHQTYLSTRPLSSRLGELPDCGAIPSPIYASRQEPCPLCNGSGVHKHGDYTYPHDLKHSTANQGRTAETVGHMPPNSSTNPYHSQPVYNPSPTQGILQGNSTTLGNQPQFSHSGQQSLFNPQHLNALSQPSGQTRTLFSSQPSPNQPQPVLNQLQPVLNQPQPVLNQQQPVSNQQQPVSNQQQPVSNQQQPVSNQQQPMSNPPQPVSSQPQAVLNQPHTMSHNPQPVLNQTPQGSVNSLSQAASVQTPTAAPAPSLYTPAANFIPLLTLPVFATTPLNTTHQGTSEKRGKNRQKSKDGRKFKKSVSKPQDTGGTTIYITPTKQRGRYYILDDKEPENGRVEEYYFRRTPRRNCGSQCSSFIRASKDSRDSSMDLDEAMKMADKLNRSSQKMLDTVRSDMFKSQLL